MTAQEKKEWLARYARLDQHIKRRLEELERLRSLAKKAAPGRGEASYGKNGINLMDGRVLKIIQLQQEINTEIDRYIDMGRQIKEAINMVKEPTLHLLMEYRYLDGKTWEYIAEQLNYSALHTRRLHGKALEAIRL